MASHAIERLRSALGRVATAREGDDDRLNDDEDRLNAAAAQAWDAGFLAGTARQIDAAHGVAAADPTTAQNPYRQRSGG